MEGVQRSIGARQFLAENAKKDGVIGLPSGLQYKILKPGRGGSSRANDAVVLESVGRQLGGREFAKSYRQATPARTRLDQLPPAWRRALPRMEEGARGGILRPLRVEWSPGASRRGVRKPGRSSSDNRDRIARGPSAGLGVATTQLTALCV